MFDPSASGYLARSQRKKRALRHRGGRRPRPPTERRGKRGGQGNGDKVTSSATAAALAQIPAVRLSAVLRAQPSLFSETGRKAEP